MTSNITVTNQAQELLNLAEELGIDLDALNAQTEAASSSNKIYTNFTSVPDIRMLLSTWNDTFNFSWNVPGQPKEYVEEFDKFPVINQLGGYIVHAELKPKLDSRVEDAKGETKTKTICSVIGYKTSGNGEVIQALPDYYPLKTMYHGWDSAAHRPNRTNPDNLVTRLGLVGSRGQTCADCIRSGNSFQITENAEGKIQEIECKVYGRLFFYVTEVYKIKKEPPVTGQTPAIKVTSMSIKELTGEDGIMLMISLPPKTGIKGIWNENPDLQRMAYSAYITDLAIKNRQNTLLKNPQFHFTTIGIRPPLPGEKSNKNYLHFESKGTYNTEDIKKAQTLWKELNPRKEIKTLDKSALYASPETIIVDNNNTPVMLRSASPTEALPLVEPEDLSNNEEFGNPFA